MSLELLLVAAGLAGLAGSTHCAGMCGPIVVLFEGPTRARSSMSPFLRRLIYNAGRGCFYAALGAIAGVSGTLLAATLGLERAASALRFIAAIMVFLLGLQLLGVAGALGAIERTGGRLWSMLSPLTRYVLPLRTPLRAFGAGVLWGALPCGLVYSAVALAAASGSPASGSVTMLAFWAGTLPAMIAAGSMARQLRTWRKNTAYRRAAGAVLVAGAVLAIALPVFMSEHRMPEAPGRHLTQHTGG